MDINGDNAIVDCGWSSQEECKDNEYGHLYFYGAGSILRNGITTGSSEPFINVEPDWYWSGTIITPSGNPVPTAFHFGSGDWSSGNRGIPLPAWAVRDGDVSIEVPFDISPQGCRNPLNVKRRGLITAAVLGTNDLDITQIDVASLRLEGVPPVRSALEDVGTPFEPYTGKEDAFDCNDFGADGQMDLILKFNAQELISALGDVEDGEVRVLTLTGALAEEFGGRPIEGEDVVVILKKGRPE